ncbi:MAG: hypothetical protein AAF533_26500 [Acidobacteriota bacterium]
MKTARCILSLSFLLVVGSAHGQGSFTEHAQNLGHAVGGDTTSGSPVGGYRDVRWGEDKKAVHEKVEGLLDSGHRLVKIGKTAGFNSGTAYFFDTETGLHLVEITLAQLHEKTIDHVGDFKDLRALLQEKYGEPKYETARWSDRTYEGDPERHGDAVKAGHLKMFCRWNKPGTRITLECFQEGGIIRNRLQYESLWHLKAGIRRSTTGKKVTTKEVAKKLDDL